MYKTLFDAVNRAKQLGSFPLANLGTALLINTATSLSDKEGLYLVWERFLLSDPSDIDHDLLIITNGDNRVSIPVQLLRDPLGIRKHCKKERRRQRENYPPIILPPIQLRAELQDLNKIMMRYTPHFRYFMDRYLLPPNNDVPRDLGFEEIAVKRVMGITSRSPINNTPSATKNPFKFQLEEIEEVGIDGEELTSPSMRAARERLLQLSALFMKWGAIDVMVADYVEALNVHNNKE